MQNKIEHTSVAGINFEPNKKLGYYLVGNNIYYNKFHAFLEGTKSNQEVKWFFNDNYFMSYPWHVEPLESLNELYRRRAQQLRDAYDYIRVEASGGSDSTTVIYSFLLNNIHLDEVVFRYPKAGEKNATSNPLDTNCENTLSEWEYAAKPLLDWIATNYPTVKITVHDYSEDIIKSSDTSDESWVFRTRHYLQPAHAHKHTNVGFIDHKRLADSNLKIAVVYGIDKPRVVIKDDKFFLYFTDSLANHNTNVIDEYTNIHSEFFYWSPDAMDLLAKQAHVIKNWFNMEQNYSFQGVVRFPNDNFAHRNMYERLVKSIIYPNYDQSTFQVSKPTNNVYNEMDFWFHQNFINTKMYNVWEAGIDFLLNNIDQRYIDQRTYKNLYGKNSTERNADFKIFNSTYYYLGESNVPQPTISHSAPVIASDYQLPYDKIYHSHMIKGKLVIY